MKTYTEDKRIRPDILTAAVYWSLAIMMLFNIISIRICGDKGLGFGIGPILLYYICYSIFVLGAQKAVYAMVRIRARRSQFINAQVNFKKSLRIFVITGILLAFAILASCYGVSIKIFNNPRGYFLYMFVAACLVFLCGQGVIRGYLQGIGYTRPILLSDLCITITTVVVGSVTSAFLYSYGLKVNNLFHVDDFSSVYGSIGIVIGLLVGSIIGFVQTFVCYYVRKNEIEAIVKSGAPRYLDNKNDVLIGIRSIAYLYVFPSLICLFDEFFYIVTMNKAGTDVDLIKEYGAFSGRVITLIAVVSIICCIPFIKSWNRVMARIERDELEGARDRLRKLVSYSTKLLIPVAIFIFVMADTIEVSLFGKGSSYVDGMLRLGGIMTALISCALFFSWLLNHMGKSVLITINLTVTLICHIGFLVVFLPVLKLGILGILYAGFIAVLVYDFLSAFMIKKMLSYRQELIKTFVYPLVCAAASGLIVFFINSVLVDFIGDILTLLLGAVIFFICYMLALVVMKAVSIHELDKMPLGKLFMGIARNFDHEVYDEE